MKSLAPEEEFDESPEEDLVPQGRASSPAQFKKALKGEIAGLARYLVEDPIYLEQLQRQMRAGRLHPMLQVALLNYAYGKPKERVEIKHAAVVRIVHEYAGAEAEKIITGVVIDGKREGDPAEVVSSANGGDEK